jgi:hypothetical protein
MPRIDTSVRGEREPAMPSSANEAVALLGLLCGVKEIDKWQLGGPAEGETSGYLTSERIGFRLYNLIVNSAIDVDLLGVEMEGLGPLPLTADRHCGWIEHTSFLGNPASG